MQSPAIRLQAGPATPLPATPVASLEMLRASARQLLAEAVNREVRHFLDSLANAAEGEARDPFVRNGLHPERMVLTGIGPVAVRLPKVRRRTGLAVRFRSALVPPYARKACPLSPDAIASYLLALARKEVGLALHALVGGGAQALPREVLRSLQDWWQSECARWDRRNEGKRHA
jgi:hypothetical protein